MAIKNPFPPEVKLSSDGKTYTANPDYLAFAACKNDRQRAELVARRQVGLPPAAKLPGLSAIYPNRQSHVNDAMRYARLKSDNGRILIDVAHEGVLDESLEESERQGWWSLYWRAARFPSAGAVNEKGETDGEVMGKTLYDILQAARNRQALPDGEQRQAVEGEVRVLQERVDDASPDAR